MESHYNQAIILAGGRGERLRPLTFDRPKPMIEVCGYPMLHYSLSWLKACGFVQVVIACGYKHQIIQEHFGDGRNFGLEIAYSIEEKPLGRGGGVKLASRKLKNPEASVLVVNGDMITKLKVSNLVRSHKNSQAKVSIVTVPLRCPYGIVETDDKNRATEFREKPTLPYWINAGIYFVDGSVLPAFPDIGDHEKILFPTLAAKGQLHAFKFEGFWRTVDTIKDLEELRQEEPVLAKWA